MSASAAGSSDLPGPLSSLPLRSFIDFLNARHALALTDKEAERSAQVLQEQWFSVAEELRAVDMEALSFLPLSKQLPLAIHSFFQPDYNPMQKWPPGGSAQSPSHGAPAAAAPLHIVPPPQSAMAASSSSASSSAHLLGADGHGAASASSLPHSRSSNFPPSGSASSASSSSASSALPAPADELKQDARTRSGSSAVGSGSAGAAAAFAALEGGIKHEGGDDGEANGFDLDVSVSRSGEGIDGSSSEETDDSGSDESQQRDDDGSADPSAAAPSGKRRKKKWDRHSSLVALSKAVEHVCTSSTRDEAVLSSLSNILRAAMNKSGRHTQNTLRDLMKKLQDKQAANGVASSASASSSSASASSSALPPPLQGVDELGARLKSLSVGGNAGPDSSKSVLPSSAALSLLSSLSVGAASPTAAAAASASASALSPTSSSSSSFSPSNYSFVCGLCHSARDKPVAVDGCGHEFCRSCLSDHLNALVGQKAAVGITCPYTSPNGSGSCPCELSTGTIQSVLTPADFESYLNATLMSFIESDDCLTVTCPNAKCASLMSVEPLANRDVPEVITEKDEDGRVLTKETFLHFKEFRVRCRECQTNFCAKCKAEPYHKGYTCAGFKEYQASRHCRFCSSKLTAEEALRPSNGVRDVCAQSDCQSKSLVCCEKTLPCGCACNGIKNETTCLPCLKHDLNIDEDEYCGICYVEGLKDAPCLQSQGSCTHVFHFQCLVKKLESKWPGARIDCQIAKGCPLCKKELRHPALAHLLAPIDALESIIKDRAMQRLKYEGREKDAAIANANGAFHDDPVGFAMKQYLFYMCFKCNLPYFAEANQAFDPSELVCPGCQPHSVEDCALHGRDWLAYKCRYCCSFATWTCWSNTHFCDKCHKSGVWQNLAVFRTGKNKKKLWEYEQCASLQGPVAAIGAEMGGTEEEKNARIAKLLCAPRSCPLGVRHPPNGLEFGLGCSMCSDKQSAGDALQAVEAVRAKLVAVRSELGRLGSRRFVPTSDFDMEGVFWYLGTCARTQVWSNPAEAGFVKISSSGCMDDSAPLSALVGRDLVRLVSKPVRHSWFSWELIDLQLCLTHYTLKHYNSWDTECLRHWSLEGSNDGGSRWELIATHANDDSLDRKGATKTWKVESGGRRYSMFRILQTGRNSNNNFYLALSGLECYGELSLAPVAPPAGAAPVGAAMPVALPVGAGAAGGPRLQFVPRSDFDESGIIHYLGTRYGQGPWRNPCELGLARAYFSELAAGPPPSAPASALLGKDVVRCVSAAKPLQYFVVDLTPSGKCVRPSHYSLRHYSSWDLEALRNWRFEGSINGVEWAALSVHTNDSSLDKKGATRTWALPGCQVVCTMFRVVQTGLNSNQHHYLACSGFEVYGVLEDVSPSLAQYQRELAQGMRAGQGQAPPPFPAGPALAPGFAQQPNPLAPPPQQQQHAVLNQQLQLPQQTPLPPPTAGVLVPPLVAGPPSAADSGLVILRYQSDFDQNGAFYYLGTSGRRAPWRNPAEVGLVAVRASELAVAPPSMPASAIVGREVVRCCTPGKADMFFIIDLRDKLLMATHYSLRHYSTYDTEALRNWTLEGSVDGQRWDLLRVHRDDRALALRGATATWPLQPAGRFYRFFKITQTGHNSNNNFYMCCSGCELYGLLQLWPATSTPEAAAQQAAAQAAGWRGDSVDAVRAVQKQWASAYEQRAPLAAFQPPQPQGYPGAVAALGQPPLMAAQSAAPPLQLIPAQANAPLLGGQPAGAALVPAGPAAGVGVAGGPPAVAVPPSYPPFFDGMEFIYQHDLDANGILYWLGTQRGTRPWANPADLGLVQVTSVPLAIAPRSEPASAIVGRSLCRCVTLPNRESWFVIDLLNVWVRPTAYTLRHYSSWDTEALRDWKLQGSNDGKKWTKLLSHKKDESLNAKGAAKTWQIPKPKKSYRMFRILQTGKNSNNHWYCALSSIEIYGKVYSFKK